MFCVAAQIVCFTENSYRCWTGRGKGLRTMHELPPRGTYGRKYEGFQRPYELMQSFLSRALLQAILEYVQSSHEPGELSRHHFLHIIERYSQCRRSFQPCEVTRMRPTAGWGAMS